MIRKSVIMYKKRRIVINPSFDRVLTFYSLLDDKELDEATKVECALSIFIPNNRIFLWAIPISVKSELLEQIIKEYIFIPPRSGNRNNNCLVLDFNLDKDYIYSSFIKDYKIDLIKEQGKLPWKDFISLFQGLSDDTKMKEVMKIRSMEIPSYNGSNSKNIQNITELKSYYALPVKGNGGQSGLNRLFASLEAQAVRV